MDRQICGDTNGCRCFLLLSFSERNGDGWRERRRDATPSTSVRMVYGDRVFVKLKQSCWMNPEERKGGGEDRGGERRRGD